MSGSTAQPEQAPVEVTKQAPPAEDAAPATEQPTTDEPEEQLTEEAKTAAVKELTAKGTALFGQKNFEEAAEVFSKATAYQAELNGETAPENAEVLFYYGRSLFKVGQSKSDVLGGQAATEKKQANGKPTAEAAAPAAAKPEEKAEEPKEAVPDAKKALFQFTGDENFDDDEDEEEGEGEAEEEDDDLATAFEILDLARVCFVKQLEALTTAGKGKEVGMSAEERHIKERLADTHDALSEISLENERYPNAVEDGRTALAYKMELYPEESEIIAEAHYKLSLSLEFASVTSTTPEGEAPKEGEEAKNKTEELDQGLRDEAVKEMELAIKSFKLKLAAKQKQLAEAPESEDNSLGRKAVIEMKELIADMETRLIDLQRDPINAEDFLSGPDNALGGLLGAAVSGETATERKARIDEATANANSVQSLVRKKPKTAPAALKPEAAVPAPAPSKNKRKAEDDLEEVNGTETLKKAKVDA